jgi:ABC-type phosphate transport system substrate-binding protein
MYTFSQPQGALQVYLNWIFTAEAQAIVEELGFVPVAVTDPG